MSSAHAITTLVPVELLKALQHNGEVLVGCWLGALRVFIGCVRQPRRH